MGQVYIDEQGNVAFDTTPDGSLARKAAITNGLCRVADLTERLLLKTAEVSLLRNQNTDAVEKGLSALGKIKAEIANR